MRALLIFAVLLCGCNRHNSIGSIRYDYPPHMAEYGVPGCSVWDLDSPKLRGPVSFEHLNKRDYVVFKAPKGHRLRWKCQGYMKRVLKTQKHFPIIPTRPDLNEWEQVTSEEEGVAR